MTTEKSAFSSAAAPPESPFRSSLLEGIYSPPSDAPVAVASPKFAGADWSSMQPVFQAARGEVSFSTAAENAAAGVQPDFIMGADGVVRDNPAKTEPPADGKLNIQMEAEDQANTSLVAAKNLANENQKKAVREMIDYFTKNNPGASVPQHWLDMLSVAPEDIPAPSRRSEAPPPPQSSAPSRSSGGGYSGGGGGYRGGGGGGGGGYRGGGSDGGFVRDPEVANRPAVQLPGPVAGDLMIKGPPTITAEKIDQILRQFNSPAAGLGEHIMAKGKETGINPAVALAFFIQESSCGTAGVAARTNSWGNIKGEGPAGSDSGFRKYNNFKEGVDDWFRLINEKYVADPSEGGRGAKTLSQVLSVYAPKSENDTERYVANVKGMVEGWKRETTASA